MGAPSANAGAFEGCEIKQLISRQKDAKLVWIRLKILLHLSKFD